MLSAIEVQRLSTLTLEDRQIIVGHLKDDQRHRGPVLVADAIGPEAGGRRLSADQFVADGGTLVALGEATGLLLEKLPLAVKDLKRTYSRDQHFAPADSGCGGRRDEHDGVLVVESGGCGSAGDLHGDR